MILDLDVCVGGDVFRFQAGHWAQRHNVGSMETLAALIAPMRDVDVLRPETLGVPAPNNEQAFWLENRERIQSPDLEEDLAVRLAGRFYLGFETPPSIWKMACRLCPGAVDIRLHPVRFGDQILLLARSNGVLNPGPEARHAAKATLAWARTRLRNAVRQNIVESSSANSNSSARARCNALIALQVSDDSALIQGQTIVAIENFSDQIRSTAAEFDTVYVKCHWHEDASFETWCALIGIPNVWISSDNIYALLLGGGVENVIAISSSVLHEAEALGICATALDGSLSHGFPILPEYQAITVVDLVHEIVGYNIQQRLDGRLPGAVELFGRPAADASALQLQESAAPWPEGRVSAGDAALAAAFGHGWNPPEAWGRWTNGKVAALNFRWPEGRSAFLTMELELAIVAGPGQDGDDVELWSQGQLLAQVRVRDYRLGLTSVCLGVPPPAAGGLVQILVVRRSTVCPAEVEVSADTRRLGVAFFHANSPA